METSEYQREIREARNSTWDNRDPEVDTSGLVWTEAEKIETARSAEKNDWENQCRRKAALENERRANAARDDDPERMDLQIEPVLLRSTSPAFEAAPSARRHLIPAASCATTWGYVFDRARRKATRAWADMLVVSATSPKISPKRSADGKMRTSFSSGAPDPSRLAVTLI